jgi:hypothetical protein
MLSGAASLIFGIAIIKSTVLRKWIGAVGIAASVVTLASGVVMAYVGFSSARDLVRSLDTHFPSSVSNPWYFYVEKNNGKEGHH